ncbi:MAG: TIGR03960 family B12-binding radical SAM protein [Candidatus Omnitrophica bacterium]|nr:TIGR03960 family B12-binding radical SAM protein [Candidatus Omnitrophota bacterium]
MKTIIDLDTVLEGVQKPGRYIGNEVNSVIKEWTPAMVAFVFAFPDLYEIGMSHVGLQILYSIINKNEHFVCERVFAPAPDMEARLHATDTPLFSIETKVPLFAFDMVGFSLQYELHYTQVLAILNLGRIPLYSQERTHEHPIVIAGGPCAVNPEPLADFIDVFVIGDGEEIVPELLEEYRDIKKECSPEDRKKRFFEQIKDRDGVYVPSLYELDEAGQFKKPKITRRINKRIVRDIDSVDFPTAPIIPYIRIVHERANVEVMRGCPRQCKFCQARSVYWPLRKRTSEKIRSLVRQVIDNTGYAEVSLQSLSIGDYPGIEEMLMELTNELSVEKVSVSFPSLRVEKVLKILTDYSSLVRKTGLTFALEAGSEELRDSIKKDIDVSIFFKTLESVLASNNDTIKLYFMMGLPGETMRDIEAIVELIRKILAMARVARKKRFRVNVGVSTFVPKPHTDLECEGLASEENIKAKQSLLRDALMPLHQVKLSLTNYPITFFEALLSRGDRAVGALIMHAWQKGARLDGWAEHFDPDLWWAVTRELNFNCAKYLYDPINDRTALPWSFIECRPEVTAKGRHEE